MKSIENDILELKGIAEDSSITVPPGLKGEIEASLNTLAFLGEKPSGRLRPAAYIISAAASLAVLVGIGLGVSSSIRDNRIPEDTFTDPYLAYAQLEQTFSMISEKMDKGLSIAQGAEEVLAKTNEIMEKIN